MPCMKVADYFRVAVKHLNFCEKILNSSVSKDENDLIEIYYMLGYIFEGFAVYIAHKLEHGEDKICWNDSNDVESFFDIDFSSASHLAYHEKKHYENELRKNLKDAREKGCLDQNQRPDYYINKCYLCSDCSQLSSQNVTMSDDEKEKMVKKKFDAVKLKFCVKNHSFNKENGLVENCIKKELHGFVSEYGALPYFGGTPNIQDAEEAKEYNEQMDLIKNWSTELRYNCCDDGHLKEKIKEKITEKNLRKLTEYCETIFKLIPSYLPH